MYVCFACRRRKGRETEKDKSPHQCCDGTARDSAGQPFTVFTRDGVPRGGLVSVPASQIEPNWLPYVLVRDLDQTIGKARELGASVLAREPGAAILLDPTGAAVGIVTPEGVGQ